MAGYRLALTAALGVSMAMASSANATLVNFNYSAVVNAANQPPPPGAIALQPTVAQVGTKMGTFSGTGSLIGTYSANAAADGVVIGSLPPPPAMANKYSAPFLTPTTQTTLPYFSTAKGAITTSFNVQENFLGVLWGSVDDSNALTFFSGPNGTGTNLGTIFGNDVAPFVDGLQTFGGSRYVDVNFITPYQSFVTTSGIVSYEYSNLTASPASVPEPLSIALLGTGLCGLGLLRRRRAR